MKRIFSGLSAIFLVAISLMQLTACKSPEPESTSQVLTLEQAKEQLKGTGSTYVDTAEKASQLAGYPVATPAFVPEGFVPVVISTGIFRVYTLGIGVPASEQAEFPYDVEQWYATTPFPIKPDEPFFIIAQSRNQIHGIGKELVDIGGNPGKKVLSQDADSGLGRLQLSWSDGTMHYVLEGRLAAPLDEATLLKVAGSMGSH